MINISLRTLTMWDFLKNLLGYPRHEVVAPVAPYKVEVPVVAPIIEVIATPAVTKVIKPAVAAKAKKAVVKAPVPAITAKKPKATPAK